MKRFLALGANLTPSPSFYLDLAYAHPVRIDEHHLSQVARSETGGYFQTLHHPDVCHESRYGSENGKAALPVRW